MDSNLLGRLLIDVVEDDDEEGVLRLAEILINDGAYINPPNPRANFTALLGAVQRGYVPLAKMLIEKGAIINGIKGFNHGETLLMIAVKRGSLDLVKLLVEKGSDVNEVASCFCTALSTARGKGNKEIEGYLVSLGAVVICPKISNDGSWHCTLPEGHEGECKY